MTFKQFIARLEFSFNMWKATERCYMTTYYYDTERTTWFSKVVFKRNTIHDNWESIEKQKQWSQNITKELSK